MGTEIIIAGECSIHKCPLYACPSDCPNKSGSTELAVSTKEIRKFKPAEIMQEIARIAKADRIDYEDLIVERGTSFDNDGNLIYVSTKVKPEIAKERNCGNIWYIYMVKGTLGPIGESVSTCIMKADSTIDQPDVVDYVNVVSEYDDVNNVWKN